MDFVLEIPNNLSADKCEEIIKRFEDDDRKRPGITLGGAQGNREEDPTKKSIDLHVSGLDEWRDIDTYLHKQLTEGLEKYASHLQKLGASSMNRFHTPDCHDSGYQIQKTVPAGFYGWHDDSYCKNGRYLTYIWYLTSHDPITNGGGTAFHPTAGDGGKVIRPEQGKLLLFPATWTYTHMGLPLVTGNPKYICTGWMQSLNA
jgi:hypothetical protein